MSKPQNETLHWSYLGLVFMGLLITVIPVIGSNLKSPIYLGRSLRPVPLRTETCQATDERATDRFLCEVRSQFNPKDTWYLGSTDNSSATIPWLNRHESERSQSFEN